MNMHAGLRTHTFRRTSPKCVYGAEVLVTPPRLLAKLSLCVCVCVCVLHRLCFARSPQQMPEREENVLLMTVIV